MTDKVYHFDFGNICEMTHGILKDILIALQDKNYDKATDKAMAGLRTIEKFQKLYESKCKNG